MYLFYYLKTYFEYMCVACKLKLKWFHLVLCCSNETFILNYIHLSFYVLANWLVTEISIFWINVCLFFSELHVLTSKCSILSCTYLALYLTRIVDSEPHSIQNNINPNHLVTVSEELLISYNIIIWQGKYIRWFDVFISDNISKTFLK